MSSIWSYVQQHKRWIFILFVIATINACLNIGIIVSERMAHHETLDWTFYLINEFSGSYLLLFMLPFLVIFFQKWPLRNPWLLPKIMLYLGASVVFGLVYTSMMYGLRVPLYKLAGITRLSEIFNDLPYRYLMEYFKQFFDFWLIYIVYWAITQYQSNQKRERKEALLKEELLKSQLQSLQMQLHPHFFFNTLNTISSLMYQDPARADKLISRLSSFLRNVIELKDQPLHSLKKEVELLKQFTDVMLERYPDKLSVAYEISDDCQQVQVPVLLLQPIVENAIQYAIDFQQHTHIHIHAACSDHQLRLSISDNGPGIQEGSLSQGTGLSSTVLRLEKIYPDQYEFDLLNGSSGGLHVHMSIPKAQRA